MHSSISAHIAKEYLLDEARDVWGPNMPLFRDRLGNQGLAHAPLAWAQTSVSSLLWHVLQRLHCLLLHLQGLSHQLEHERCIQYTTPETRPATGQCIGVLHSLLSFMIPDHTFQEFCGPIPQKRLVCAAVRERVENLYFAYLFVLRATLKAAPLLEEIAYDTGFPEEDARTAELVRKLVSHLALAVCAVAG